MHSKYCECFVAFNRVSSLQPQSILYLVLHNRFKVKPHDISADCQKTISSSRGYQRKWYVFQCAPHNFADYF